MSVFVFPLVFRIHPVGVGIGIAIWALQGDNVLRQLWLWNEIFLDVAEDWGDWKVIRGLQWEWRR